MKKKNMIKLSFCEVFGLTNLATEKSSCLIGELLNVF